VVARAAAAVGVSGFFMETHPDPSCALSDGPNMVPIDKMAEMLKSLQDIDNITKQNGFLEDKLS
jgi:2-dehydro-3-deoxyphosphooctonate aldolase (KDO 8-P synthase)